MRQGQLPLCEFCGARGPHVWLFSRQDPEDRENLVLYWACQGCRATRAESWRSEQLHSWIRLETRPAAAGSPGVFRRDSGSFPRCSFCCDEGPHMWQYRRQDPEDAEQAVLHWCCDRCYVTQRDASNRRQTPGAKLQRVSPVCAHNPDHTRKNWSEIFPDCYFCLKEGAHEWQICVPNPYLSEPDRLVPVLHWCCADCRLDTRFNWRRPRAKGQAPLRAEYRLPARAIPSHSGCSATIDVKIPKCCSSEFHVIAALRVDIAESCYIASAVQKKLRGSSFPSFPSRNICA